MDQCRGLEGLSGLLLGEVPGGEAAQLLVDDGQEIVCRLQVSALSRAQDSCDLTGIWVRLQLGCPRGPWGYARLPHSGQAASRCSWAAAALPWPPRQRSSITPSRGCAPGMMSKVPKKRPRLLGAKARDELVLVLHAQLPKHLDLAPYIHGTPLPHSGAILT